MTTRTLEEILREYEDDPRPDAFDRLVPAIRALGRSEGYAEGVEAASEVAASAGYEQTALRILALRAPSPKEDALRCPGCGAKLSADDYALAVRKYSFRPGLANNLNGWAAPFTSECQACGHSTAGSGR